MGAATRRACVGTLLVALGVLPACGALGGGAGVDLVLHVADGHVREKGVECAGTGPWRRVHAGAEFVVESESGEVLAEGELPPGSSVDARPEIGWRTERRPTNCTFDVEVSDLPERDVYHLRVADRPPIEFESERLEDEEPLHLLVE